jgi:hypothetical protein
MSGFVQPAPESVKDVSFAGVFLFDPSGTSEPERDIIETICF